MLMRIIIVYARDEHLQHSRVQPGKHEDIPEKKSSASGTSERSRGTRTRYRRISFTLGKPYSTVQELKHNRVDIFPVPISVKLPASQLPARPLPYMAREKEHFKFGVPSATELRRSLKLENSKTHLLLRQHKQP